MYIYVIQKVNYFYDHTNIDEQNKKSNKNLKKTRYFIEKE